MPTIFGHITAGLTTGTMFPGELLPKRAWLIGIVCAIAPDLDAVGYKLGIPYNHFLGHRGLSHSLLFAALLAILLWIATTAWLRRASPWAISGYFFLCAASHGFLDAFTNGGLGIAFLTPFSNHRFFMPWRPIQVSPLSVWHFFTIRSFRVLWSEMYWIGLPSLFVAAVSILMHRRAAAHILTREE